MKIHSTNTSSTGRPTADRFHRSSMFSVSKRTILRGLSSGCAAMTMLALAIVANAQSAGVELQLAGGGLINHGDQAYRVVNAASYRTAADVASPGSDIQQVGLMQHASGHCTSCGTSSCGGSCGTISMQTAACGSCGTSCGGRCGRVSALSCQGAFAGVCEPCHPYRYVSVEAVYMDRYNDDLTFSQNFGMGSSDYEWAPRITIGSVSDCVHGYEASFVGPLEWTSFGQSPAGVINTLLVPGLPVAASDLSTFVGATSQNQRLEADYSSFEVSRTLVGWEMAKLLLGGRYINYDEDFRYNTVNAGQTGTLHSTGQNDLLGLQVGIDLLYPISRHAFSDLRARAGAYANLADTSVQLVNNGANILNNNDDDISLAGMFEIGSGVRYQLGEILSVRAGVELWYLAGVAKAGDQISTVVRPAMGRTSDTDGDVLITGISFGAEARW